MGKRGRKSVGEQGTPFERLQSEIRITNILLAAQLREHLGQAEIVRILSTHTRLTAQEMGDILGTSAAVVAVTKTRLRKQREKDITHGKEGTPEADLREAGIRRARQDGVVAPSGGDDGEHGARGNDRDLRIGGDEDGARDEGSGLATEAVPSPAGTSEEDA